MERVLADVDTDCCNGFKADGLAWHGMLLVLAVPCHLCGWVGQEHGGSIPLADLAPQRLATASDLGGKQLVILSRRELVAERAARCALRDSLVTREADLAAAGRTMSNGSTNSASSLIRASPAFGRPLCGGLPPVALNIPKYRSQCLPHNGV